MKKLFPKMVTLSLMLILAFSFAACGTISTGDADYVDSSDKTAVNDGTPGECTISIDCKTILDNMASLDKAKKDFVPEDGVILPETTVAFEAGDTVFDLLKKVTRENNIQMEFEDSPSYDGGYVKGIANLYEFDCGDLSGWVFLVNDWSPNYSSSHYEVSDGDVIQWWYSCQSGKDLP